jgi:hypothetical protein
MRTEYGFSRTACACAFCQAPCRHVPACLDPADLPRLCPQGRELFAWAEEHLRARVGRPVPTLVPLRGPDGACNWYFNGRCAVHADAPYGCAFFDTHQSADEIEQRYAASLQARREDAAAGGLYCRVWLHLCQRGLIDRADGRPALQEEIARMQSSRERRGRQIRSVKQPRQNHPTP